MLQVIEEILRRDEDETPVSFVYSNKTPEDILMRDHLEELAQKHDQFKVFHTVSKAPEGWQGGEGHVDKEMVQAHLPPPADDTLILVRCGSDVLA